MLNKLWPMLIVFSIICAILTGRIEEFNSSLFDSAKEAVTVSFAMLGTLCFWSGIMKTASETSIIEKIKQFLSPSINKIFKDIDKDEEIKEQISMNIIANIMGLGNAATPIGLKAMKLLQEKNSEKDKLSNNMAMLIVINTASLQIIPTTVIAVRNALGANDIARIIIPIWISTFFAAITVISISKILMKKY